jgi:hypothetical protein
MSILLIVAVVLIAAGVIVFVLKGPDLGSGERDERGSDSPGPLSSDGPPSMGSGDGGGGGVA